MPVEDAPSQSASVAPNQYVCWPHPYRDGKIYFHAHVVTKLSSQALESADKSAEIGGVLWGKAGPNDSIVIVDASRVSSTGALFNATATDARNLEQALNGRAPHASLSLAGYFRSSVRGRVALTPEDQVIIRRQLEDPDSIFLVIKPFKFGVCTAAMYFWHNGQLESGSSDLEVPFVVNGSNLELDPSAQESETALAPELAPRRESGSGEPEKHMPTVSKSTKAPSDTHSSELSIVAFLRESAMRNSALQDSSPKVASENPAHANRPESAIPSLWQKIAIPVLFLLFLLVSGFGLYLALPTLRSKLAGRSTEPSPPGLNLRIVRLAEGQVNLNWNRNDPELLKAKRGDLVISEGRRVKRLRLDNEQLRLGKLFYTPKGSDVQFRLELYVDDQRTVAESVRTPPAKSKANRSEQPTYSEGQSRRPVISEGGRELRLGNGLGSLADSTIPGESTVVVPVSTSRGDGKQLRPPAQQPVAFVDSAAGGSKPQAPAPGTFIPPRVVEEMMPETAPRGPFGEVSVRVDVDTQGRVTNAHALNADAVNDITLTESAIAAARQWRFKPATLNNEAVPADYTIVFAFRVQPR